MDLLNELQSHLSHYEMIYGSCERVDEMVQLLSCFDDCPGYAYWMTMPDYIYLIASH